MATRGKRAKKPAPKEPTGKTDLGDDDMRALAVNHVAKFEKALAAKKKTDADFRNACKLIKAELGDDGVDVVKAMIDMQTPEGEAKAKARVEAQAKAFKWGGNVALGTQLMMDLESPDRTPSVDRAYDEGKAASMADKSKYPPYDPSTPQYAKWMEGYDKDQERKVMALKPKPDDKDVRPRFLQEKDKAREAEGAEKKPALVN